MAQAKRSKSSKAKRAKSKKNGRAITGVFAWLAVFAVVGAIVTIALLQTGIRNGTGGSPVPSYEPREGAEPDAPDLLPDVADLTELFPVETPGVAVSPAPEETAGPVVSPARISGSSPSPTRVAVPSGGPITLFTPRPSPQPLSSPKPQKPKIIYMVVDDVGNNIQHLREYLAFQGDLTFAVLPNLTRSIEAAEMVRKTGQGLILHQPMEAVNGQNPGPGLVSGTMPKDEIGRIFDSNLDQLGSVEGANNHMGSLGTTQETVLGPVLLELKARHLFFLDSRTTKDSIAVKLAKELGVPVVSRDVFLDNEPNIDAITDSLNTALGIARKRGYVVMIGHEWSPQLAKLLVDDYPRLVSEGYVFKKLSTFFGVQQ